MKTINVKDTELWPPENIVRAKYYLSQVKKALNPDDHEASLLEEEAKRDLHALLESETSGTARAYEGNDKLLFDYIVQWECRLVTPRAPPQLATPPVIARIVSILFTAWSWVFNLFYFRRYSGRAII